MLNCFQPSLQKSKLNFRLYCYFQLFPFECLVFYLVVIVLALAAGKVLVENFYSFPLHASA